jgi:TRAP-type C4-dicarboxylate transport system permease small subunit
MSNPNNLGVGNGARTSLKNYFSDEVKLYLALKLLVAILLFGMAALTFVDVVGRYIFSAPIPGTFETVGLLMGLVTFSALPLVTRAENHITVDLFDGFIKGKFRKVQQLFILVGCSIVIGFFSERLIATAIDEHNANYVTEYFGISRAPLLIFLAILCIITTLILVMMTWKYLNGSLEKIKTHGESDVIEIITKSASE